MPVIFLKLPNYLCSLKRWLSYARKSTFSLFDRGPPVKKDPTALSKGHRFSRVSQRYASLNPGHKGKKSAEQKMLLKKHDCKNVSLNRWHVIYELFPRFLFAIAIEFEDLQINARKGNSWWKRIFIKNTLGPWFFLIFFYLHCCIPWIMAYRWLVKFFLLLMRNADKERILRRLFNRFP